MLWFGWRMSGLDVKLLMQEVGSTAAVAGAEAARSATNSTVIGNPITVPDHTLHNSTKFADGVRSSLTCPTVPLPKVLCATIMGHDSRILQNIKDNVLSPMVTCDWAFISYTDKSAKLDELHQQAETLGKKIVLRRDGQKRPRTPKVLFWPMFQPYLADYDYVWLLDEDLSFNGFDYNGFMSVLMLAFSNGPPLIAQPVLYKPGENDTLYYNEQLHSKHCSRKLKDPWFWIDGNRTQTAAALVAFVELQGPILDAAFFDWFLKE
eukprot:14265-Heterococcus_DN1.PRE.1